MIRGLFIVRLTVLFQTLVGSNAVDCDLECLYQNLSTTFESDPYGKLPIFQLHNTYFGPKPAAKVKRLYKFMGWGRHESLNLRGPFSIKLSRSKLQMRLTAYMETDRTSSSTHSFYESSNNNNTTTKRISFPVQVEHVYTLEDHGYVAIAVGMIFIKPVGIDSEPASPSHNTTLKSITKMLLPHSSHRLTFPKVLNTLVKIPIVEFGIIGVTHDELSLRNPSMRYNAARKSGFVARLYFDSFQSGLLRNQDVLASAIRIIGKIPLSPAREAMSVVVHKHRLFCRMFPASFFYKWSVWQKLCKRDRETEEAQEMLYHKHHRGCSWMMVAFDTGFGENPVSHLYNLIIGDGPSLSIGVTDVRLYNKERTPSSYKKVISKVIPTLPSSPRFKILDASGVVSWTPIHGISIGGVFEARMKIFGQPHVFLGELALSTIGTYSVSMFFNGMLTVPFNKLPIFHIGNLQMHGEVLAGVIPVAGIAGGEVQIGWGGGRNDDNVLPRLKGMALIETNAIHSWADNYIYIKLNPVTIQSLLNTVVGHNTKLPSLIANIGISGIDSRVNSHSVRETFNTSGSINNRFNPPARILENPEQFVMTFAPIEVQNNAIAEIDNSAMILPGLTVIGKVTLLGNVSASAYVRVDPLSLGLTIDFEMLPMVFGNGLLSFTRSIDDQSAGPLIYASASILKARSHPLGFKFQGAVSVFGASAAVSADISTDGIDLRTEIMVWKDWFKASLDIKLLRNPGEFLLRGHVRLGSLNDLVSGFFHTVIKKIGKIMLGRKLGYSVRKFRHKVKKLLKKGIRHVTHVKLTSLTFELSHANNLQPKHFPLRAAFKFKIFGIKLLRFNNVHVDVAKSINTTVAADTIANEVAHTMENLISKCVYEEEECISELESEIN